MSQWRQSKLSLTLGPVDSMLDGLRATANATREAVDPLVTALDLLKGVFALTDPQLFDLSFLLQYLFTVEYVHLYPKQPYQVLRRSEFLQQAATILGDRNNHCVYPPYHLFVFAVSAPTFEELTALSVGLEGLFDAFSLGVDDSPQELDRSRALSSPLECASLGDLIPVLGELGDILEALALQDSAGSLGLMRDLLIAKLEQIKARILGLDRILARIESIPDVDVWIFDCDGLESESALTSALLGAQDGPAQNSYLAGTIVVTGTPGGLLMRGLLGGLS